jgi:hypothetical protein
MLKDYLTKKGGEKKVKAWICFDPQGFEQPYLYSEKPSRKETALNKKFGLEVYPCTIIYNPTKS